MSRPVARQGALVLVALLSFACTSPPDKEMHQAQGAIDAARAAGAAEYAAEEFRAAEGALSKSQAAVAERDYRQALSFAIDARERAQEAARTAAENRARARSEIDQVLANADAAYERAAEALDAATAAKVPAAQLAPAAKVLAEARTSLNTARAAVEAGDYAGARASVEPLEITIEAARSEIDAAVQSRANRRPARRGSR
jgi:hypothetical protein